MTLPNESYTRSPSHTWVYKPCIVHGGPAPAGDSAAQQHRPKPLRARDRSLPLTITVQYRGGPEASWLIGYRGRFYRFGGHLFLHDVLAHLSEQHGRPDPKPIRGRDRV
jgi:hypothetical protein